VKKIVAISLFLFIALPIFAGTITQSVSSLSNFGNVYPFFSSTSLRYTVSGASLTSNLIVTADNGFEVSTTYSLGYSKSLTLVPISGTVAATTIFVRFSPSAVGSASGNIVNSSVGSTSQNVSVSGTCIAWAIPANYYVTVNTQTGASLKTILYTKILGHTDIPYGSGTTCTNCVWGAFQTTDVQPNGKVWDIYSTRFDQASPYEYTMRANQCGTYSIEGDCYNREHSFPKSWFNDALPMHDDLFHLLASDGKVNGLRNNYPYGNVSSATNTSLYGGKLGTGTNNYGYTSTVFEPIDEYKGDFARGYFYMATRYENIIAGWFTNTGASAVLDGTSFPCFTPWQQSLLLEWNNLDPVSDKEIKRNNAIFALQGNRNPFIDSPQFAQRIWGGSIQAKPTIAASNLTITNNSNTNITLNWKSGNGNRRLVIIKAGSAVNAFPLDSNYYAADANVNVAPQLGSGNVIVYNGTGSSVTLNNLVQGTTYHYAVIEYNGWYSTSNYQTTGILTSNSTTLPVELLSFTAKAQSSDAVLLSWTTASELNNESFIIERSLDAKNWEPITKVKGAGTTSKRNNYQYLDPIFKNSTISLSLANPSPSTLCYRLKQTDVDGTATYSKMAVVTFNANEFGQVTVSPNPFSNVLRIFIQTPITGELSYSIQNLIGETYVDKKIYIQDGTKQQIECGGMDELPSGIFVLQLQYAGKNYRYKITKQ
jgi:endonuclease I